MGFLLFGSWFVIGNRNLVSTKISNNYTSTRHSLHFTSRFISFKHLLLRKIQDTIPPPDNSPGMRGALPTVLVHGTDTALSALFDPCR